MTTIIIRDPIRAAVEAASGGARTVIYTAKGQPSFMNVIPKQTMNQLLPNAGVTIHGVHPAFIVNGAEKSELLIGTYQATLSNGELLSLPNAAPVVARVMASAKTLANAAGAGHHLMTMAEYGLLNCLADLTKNNYGNGYYGRSANNADLKGRRVDKAPAGDMTNPQQAWTLTGSGPLQWNFNEEYNGIADLAGNVGEVCTGFRVVNSEIQVIANNDSAMSSTDISGASTAWRAIDGETGALVATGHANAVKVAGSGTDPYTIVFVHWSDPRFYTNPSSTPVKKPALDRLIALGFLTKDTTISTNARVAFPGPTANVIPVIGGNFSISNSSLQTKLYISEVSADNFVGFRTAYYA